MPADTPLVPAMLRCTSFLTIQYIFPGITLYKQVHSRATKSVKFIIT